MLDNKHEAGECMRLSEFQEKEVINLCDCKRLGYVSDLHIDECNGCITAIILPGESKFCGLFGNQTELVIISSAFTSARDVHLPGNNSFRGHWKVRRKQTSHPAVHLQQPELRRGVYNYRSQDWKGLDMLQK